MDFALVQLKNSSNVQLNVDRIQFYMKSHPEVDCFVFPECALTGYDSENWVQLSEDDPVFLFLLQLAQQYDCHIFIGAATNKHIAYYHISNTIESYYKCHLGLKEKAVFEQGHTLKLFHVEDVSIGIALCIESHIPDLTQTYRLLGADVMIMPFASPDVCGKREKIWNKYLPARAYDNGVYVFACNLTGEGYSGGAVVYDDKGDVIVEDYEGHETMIKVSIDTTQIKHRRTSVKTNYINRRRPELYRKDRYGVY